MPFRLAVFGVNKADHVMKQKCRSRSGGRPLTCVIENRPPVVIYLFVLIVTALVQLVAVPFWSTSLARK